MPYIVTTRQLVKASGYGQREEFEYQSSRRAVATLDEAREAAHRQATESVGMEGEGHGAIDKLSESGGTIGPLPDGTVIEVERVGWVALRDYLPTSERIGRVGLVAGTEAIAAYNAAQ